MKRIIAFLMVSLLLLCNLASAEAEVDLTGMGYDELLELKKQVDLAIQKLNLAEEKPLLYEDDVLSIRYSGIELDEFPDSAYLHISFLFENKTPDEIEVTCDTVIINGCAVYLSKFVNIPSDCVYIHEWTTDADTFLEYGLDVDGIETISMTFDVNYGENIRSETIVVPQ